MAEPVGFIGLGNMGEPIAANLLAAGFALKVYNRTTSKAEPLVKSGAALADKAADVATAGGIVFTLVSDDRALDEICSAQPSFVEKLGPGGVHVSLSTIAPATANRLAEQHKKFQVSYVAAPVFGRPEAAASRQMAICVSGAAAARKRIEPLLAAIGRATFDFGETAGAANVVKLCGNFMIASAVEALSEAFVLAKKNGVDAVAMSSMFSETLFACPIYRIYGKLILDGNFEPAKFRMALGLKDINLALQTAAASEMPMPLASLVRDRFLASLAKGRKDFDWVALAMDVAEDAGLPKAFTR